MYAGYQRNVERIERFVLLGRFVAARTGGGKLVFISPPGPSGLEQDH